MISLHIIFYLMILFFAMIGYLRGWQKEVIALTGLIGSLAALNQFGYDIVKGISGFANSDPNIVVDPIVKFWTQAVFHSVIAFFSYQVVARLADQVLGGRLGERVRTNLEKRILGLIFGAINGYLLIGGLWSFLEYDITPSGYELFPVGQPYVFNNPDVIMRPVTETAIRMVNYLPVGLLSPTWWLVLFFIAFFVVIVALI